MPDDLGKRVFEGAGLVGTGLHVMQAAATLGLVAVAAPAALPIVVTAEVTVLAVGSGVEHLVNYEAVAGKADKLLERDGSFSGRGALTLAGTVRALSLLESVEEAEEPPRARGSSGALANGLAVRLSRPGRRSRQGAAQLP